MRFWLLAALSATVGVSAAPPLVAQRSARSGHWEGDLRWRPRQNSSRQLWLHVDGGDSRRNDHREFGFVLKVSEFTGLAADDSRWSGPANFELRRDAGTLAFEGRFEDGNGEGTYRFLPNDRFVQQVELVGAGGADDDELLAMVIHDVRTDWVASLRQTGLRNLDAGDLLAMRIHNVTPEFIRDLAELGYRNVSAGKLIALRVHDISVDDVREVHREVDATADLDDMIAFKIHGVTPAFARQVSKVGYPNADSDDLVAMRIHGVTPDFIRSIVEAGIRDIDLDELVAFRIHDIDAEFVKEAASAGIGSDPDDIVSYRILGERRWKRKR